MGDDIKRARQMTMRLFNLGEKVGCPSAGELAQLLAGNAFGQKDNAINLIKLSLETSETKCTMAPLNKSFRLFYNAREEISRPFSSRSDCLQSSVYDVLLCYMSFWGQVFEYYETMYYKPVNLPDGTTESSPATVSFEIGWKIACLFIRDMMLSTAARAAGLSSGYDRSMSWYFYPANATSELEEAKVLVLTVIAKIRKRGTVLVSGEGMIGHISFSNTMPLVHWVEDKLDKDWNNIEKLDSLCVEYFETSSIRLNVNVNCVQDGASSEDTLNTSFDPNASFLDTFDAGQTDESPGNPYSLVSMTGRSVSLNIRPITPALLGSANCDWGGVDMGEFCREVGEKCAWPEVVNTVSTAGQIGISLLNMTGEVSLVPESMSKRRRSSLSAPSRLSMTPEQGLVLPFQTPSHDMPNLEPIPKFGLGDYVHIPIPQLTPTPTGNASIMIPEFTPTPRRNRDSDVTFYTGNSPQASALASLPTELDAEFESPRKIQRVSSRPSMVVSSPAKPSGIFPNPNPVNLNQVVDCIVASAKRELSAKQWSLEASLGDLLRKGRTLSAMYALAVMSGGSELAQEETGDNQHNTGRSSKRRRSSNEIKKTANSSYILPNLSENSLETAETRLGLFLRAAERKPLRSFSTDQLGLVACMARVLVLAHMCAEKECTDEVLKMSIITAGDIVCFGTKAGPFIEENDIYAAGIRGVYADMHIGVIELGKSLGFDDWMELAIFYNDFAFTVLLGNPGGLLTPTTGKRNSSSSNTGGASKITSKHASSREALDEHCLLVSSELVNRWAFAFSSSFWALLGLLEKDFLHMRHGVSSDLYISKISREQVSKLDVFLKTTLTNAATYIVDLGDRVRSNTSVLHAAFDILRSTVLLRPHLLQGRHMHQIAQCSLMAASVLFSEPVNRVDFMALSQGALLMQRTKDAEKIVQRFVLKTVCLSVAGGDVVFSDASAALAFPGRHQPDSELTGSIQEFYEKEFVSELRQVLCNLHRTKNPKEASFLGPFPDKVSKDPSVSPFGYTALCLAMALGMHAGFNITDAVTKTIPSSHFAKALPFAAPLGIVPCLVPPLEPYKHRSANRKDRYFRWFNDTTILAKDNGVYMVLPDDN
jgi:hypothetical protein